MNIAIVTITNNGYKSGLRIKRSLTKSKLYIPAKLCKNKNAVLFDCGLTDLTQRLFKEFDGIVFCMAIGIVVRLIAPYIKDKHTDPAIVVVDESARFSISTLSGHEGGANKLAILIANILGAEPVITTASESKKKIILGIGCMAGIKKYEIIKAIKYALSKVRYSISKVRYLTTIDLKQNEKGLKEASLELGIPLRIVSFDTIKKFNGAYKRSSFVKEKIGVEGVSEPCALLTARKPELILTKTKIGRVTVAVVLEA